MGDGFVFLALKGSSFYCPVWLAHLHGVGDHPLDEALLHIVVRPSERRCVLGKRIDHLHGPERLPPLCSGCICTLRGGRL